MVARVSGPQNEQNDFFHACKWHLMKLEKKEHMHRGLVGHWGYGFTAQEIRESRRL